MLCFDSPTALASSKEFASSVVIAQWIYDTNMWSYSQFERTTRCAAMIKRSLHITQQITQCVFNGFLSACLSDKHQHSHLPLDAFQSCGSPLLMHATLDGQVPLSPLVVMVCCTISLHANKANPTETALFVMSLTCCHRLHVFLNTNTQFLSAAIMSIHLLLYYNCL